MKKLILTTAIFIASIGNAFSQTYQHDFQKIIGQYNESLKNYTLCETQDKGFALVSFKLANGNLNQNMIQVFKTDSDLNVILAQEFEYTDLGVNGCSITPNDIYETSNGDFVIAGSIGNEGIPAMSGGFLLYIKNDNNSSLHFGWMQIYPNQNNSGTAPIHSLMHVVETVEGFIAIGRESSNSTYNGVVVRTDDNGNVIWSKHLYDEEYTGITYSDLTDIVFINEEEVAIVGTVNSFPYDDADINIVRLNSNGNILSNNVYEYSGEINDLQYTYLERGVAIEFNKDKNELVVAGTVTKKLEGVCTTAEYKNILTFGIDYNSGIVNWSTRHDIGADNTLANESIFCSDIDFSSDDYAVAGTVKNAVFDNVSNYNGFILRLNSNALASNLRFYGSNNNDYFSRIYNRNGDYVAGGMLGNNYAWLVESYNSIQSTCNSLLSNAVTVQHPLVFSEGLSAKIKVLNTEVEMHEAKMKYFEKILCEKQVNIQNNSNNSQSSTIVKEAFSPSGILLEQEVSIYPNPTNGEFKVHVRNIENNIIEVVNILGRTILVKNVNRNNTNFDLSNQPNGVYFVKVISGDLMEVKRVIKN